MKKALILLLLTAIGAGALATDAASYVSDPFPTAPGKLYANATVAVLPFINNSSSNRLDYLQDAVAKMLVTDLKQSQTLKVVTRDDLDNILAELKLERSALADPANAQKLGKLLGADILVTGSILQIGGSLRFDAHVVDVATGEVVAGTKAEGAGENEVLRMVDTMAIALVGDLTGETIAVNSTDPLAGKHNPAFNTPGLTFWPILGNEYGLVGSTATAYLELKFRAGEIPTAVLKDRPPVNLVLVIDRSGSMSDAGKLEYVKTAANYVIDALGPKDRISVVAFDSDVKVVQDNTTVENKDALKSKIGDLFPGSNTNLSGGMEEGYAQAKKFHKANYLNRVILLSDGLANEGITDTEKLSSIAREWQKKGFYTTAMGVGDSYDDHLLTLLATGGAGNYYYIAQPEAVPVIFAKELAGICNVAAAGITVDLTLEPGIKLAKVRGYQYRDLGNGRYEIAVGDIPAGQEYTVFAELALPAVTEEKTVALGNVGVRYDDKIAKTAAASTPAKLAMHFVPNPTLVAANAVPEVMNTAYVMENADAMAQAQTLIGEGRRDEAKKVLEKQKDISRMRAADGQSQELLDSANKLEELEETAADDNISAPAASKAAGAAANEAAYH